MNLPKIKLDKLKHFFWGAVGLTATCILWKLVNIFHPIPVWYCIIPITLVAAYKELVRDLLQKKGRCELLDFVYTVAPCVLLLF